jgi:hypothetical protein
VGTGKFMDVPINIGVTNKMFVIKLRYLGNNKIAAGADLDDFKKEKVMEASKQVIELFRGVGQELYFEAIFINGSLILSKNIK